MLRGLWGCSVGCLCPLPRGAMALSTPSEGAPNGATYHKNGEKFRHRRLDSGSCKVQSSRSFGGGLDELLAEAEAAVEGGSTTAVNAAAAAAAANAAGARSGSARSQDIAKVQELVAQHVVEAQRAIASCHQRMLGALSQQAEAMRRHADAEDERLKDENLRLRAELAGSQHIFREAPHNGKEDRGSEDAPAERTSRPETPQIPPAGLPMLQAGGFPCIEESLPGAVEPEPELGSSAGIGLRPARVLQQRSPDLADWRFRRPGHRPQELLGGEPGSADGSHCTLSPRDQDSTGGSGHPRRGSLVSFESDRSPNYGAPNFASCREHSALYQQSALFLDADSMKEKIRAAITKPVYNVSDFYFTQGMCQRIARSTYFEQLVLIVIAINAVWIAVDSDMNESDLLLDAKPEFQVGENLFCLFFTTEWLIRFMAFAQKRNVLKDWWFMFDSLLVGLMVTETWFVTFFAYMMRMGEAGGSGNVMKQSGNTYVLRILRLMRLSRMARMARLFRLCPELMIMIKGLLVATRAVTVTLILLTLVIYVFSLLFKQLMLETESGPRYFSSVPHSMTTLLLHGVFLEESPDLFYAVGSDGIWYAFVLGIFVLLASFTVLNMLIGVMVENVRVVSVMEREQLTVAFTKQKLLRMLTTSDVDKDGNQMISQAEFSALLDIPEAIKVLQQELGVDVVGLVDLADFIFENVEELRFPQFMEVVLQLRGSNTATVKDIVDLRKCLRQELHTVQAELSELQPVEARRRKMQRRFAKTRSMTGIIKLGS